MELKGLFSRKLHSAHLFGESIWDTSIAGKRNRQLKTHVVQSTNALQVHVAPSKKSIAETDQFQGRTPSNLSRLSIFQSHLSIHRHLLPWLQLHMSWRSDLVEDALASERKDIDLGSQ